MTITTRFHPPHRPSTQMALGVCWEWVRASALMDSQVIYFPLGHYTSIFQAETHAIMQCALALNRLDPSDEHICICSDSQAVLMALCNPRVVSKQIWEWIGALSELASHRPVSLTWVPAHSGIPGNEQADHLAMTASFNHTLDQNLHFLCLIMLLRQL